MPIFATPDNPVGVAAPPSKGHKNDKKKHAAPTPPSRAMVKSGPRPHLGLTNPLQHTRVKVVRTFTKAHQIEGDGLLLLLYHQLFKKTWNARKEFQSCPGARCPDTVVYEHNFPQHWYTYDSKHGEILKRPGSFLDTAQILKYFSRPVSKDCDIVAQYLCSMENPETEEMETSVEFFTEETLKDFLQNRKHRPDGVLQRFITPKGEHNFQIQAVWSPRVTLVYKRTNNHRLKDRTVGVYERAVTCDGPPHYTRDDLLAEITRAEVVKICSNFVNHFSSTEHKPISRLVLHFKVDEKDNIWVIWASSLRIGMTKFSSSHQHIPLNLSSKFTTPDAEQQRRKATVEGEALEKQLLLKDVEQYRLSSDFMFASTFGRDPTDREGRHRPSSARGSPRRPVPPSNLIEGHSPQGTSALITLDRARPTTARNTNSPGSTSARRRRLDETTFVTSERPPFLPSPRLNAVPPPWSKQNPFHHQVQRLNLESLMNPMQLTRESGDSQQERGNVRKQVDQSAAPDNSGDRHQEGWWEHDPVAKGKYLAIRRDEETVQSWMEDLVYLVYSHTLNHGMRLLTVTPPENIWRIFLDEKGASEDCDAIMAAISMKPLNPSEDDAVVEGRTTYYFLGYGCSAKLQSEGVPVQPFAPTPSALDRPMAALAADVSEAVKKLFEGRIAELRETVQAAQQADTQLPALPAPG
eukprot:Sspe_Gene.11953::Locus_4067_Transcript_2_3_Confidence_0.286_Length_2251::g.11953::m.11953